MATVNFGGLASGLDTESIIKALMDIEKKPLSRLENDKSFLNTRLKAFGEFDKKLEALETAFKAFDSSDKFRSFSAKTASDEFFSVQTSSLAKQGSYSIEVVNLAQVQKTASNGYANTTASTLSSGTISIDTDPYNLLDPPTEINVEAGDNLSTLVDKINKANTGGTPTGVTASLFNDGTANGYRIVLSGKDASTKFEASATGVIFNGNAEPLNFNTSGQIARQANAIIDGIPIVSNNNVLKGALAGVDLTLLKANATGVKTELSVDVDREGVKTKLNAFVSAYNDIIKFITDQKDSSWANDSGMQSTKRRLQSLLVESTGGSGSLQRLAEIGISTNKNDGTISLDSTKIDILISKDFQGLENLFLGQTGSEGINKKFITFLEGMTNSTTGLYSSRKKSTASSIKGIERNIDNMELRLEKREKSMRAQFEALETLMSSMNATSNYLTQQINSMNASRR